MINFSACDCEAPLRLLPRKGWKRLLVTHRRYRCSRCKAEFVLKKGRKTSLRQRLLVSASLVLALWVAYWGAGYFEEARDAAWKRAASSE